MKFGIGRYRQEVQDVRTGDVVWEVYGRDGVFRCTVAATYCDGVDASGVRLHQADFGSTWFDSEYDAIRQAINNLKEDVARTERKVAALRARLESTPTPPDGKAVE